MPPSLALNLKTESRKATKTRSGIQYEQTYIGITDVPATQALILSLLNTSTPDHIAIGDAISGDATALCSQIEIEANGNSKLSWIIKATYLTPSLSGSTPVLPTSRPPVVRWDTENEERPLLYDYSTPNPLAIVNSAGERFDQVLVQPSAVLTLEYTRNELSPNFATIMDYENVVNSASFTIDGKTFSAGRALLTIKPGLKTTESGQTYYPVVYYFKFCAETWIVRHGKLLDYGYNEWNGTDLVPILDKDGMPVSRPWPLDGSGAAKANATDFPAYLQYKVYPAADFSVFSFT